ncbi:MAG TPA: ABC transporter, partial [Acholeplasmataceae bacterium]|nr:ABC transporter [Acholeplasmataceae bacterium]
MDEIIEASKTANVHHFIKSLPFGYDAILDENSQISQGQKQLLTIARAMVADAPMLILDEATSSV